MTTTSTPLNQSGRRYGTLTNVEVRAKADGTGMTVRGHAAVFDSPTMIGPPGMGGFEERIAKNAFAKTLADRADVRLLFNHNPDLVLARTKSGTLSLREDAIGLLVEADLAPTTVGNDLAMLLKRGDVDQMSFGFQVVKDKWEVAQRDDGSRVETRTVLEAKLFDVSAVTYPAYNDTDLAIREAVLARELRGQEVPIDIPVAETAEEPEVLAVENDREDEIRNLLKESESNLRIALDIWGDEPDQARSLIAAAHQDYRNLLRYFDCATNGNAPSAEERSEMTEPSQDSDTQPSSATEPIEERHLTLPQILLNHSKGEHRSVPRALCLACLVQTEPGTHSETSA